MYISYVKCSGRQLMHFLKSFVPVSDDTRDCDEYQDTRVNLRYMYNLLYSGKRFLFCILACLHDVF